MEHLYKVWFLYKDLNAKSDKFGLGYEASSFIKRQYQFKNKDAIHAYISNNKVITHRGKSFVLLRCGGTQYVVCKEKEFRIDIDD